MFTETISTEMLLMHLALNHRHFEMTTVAATPDGASWS